jgi:hypothetical protein
VLAAELAEVPLKLAEVSILAISGLIKKELVPTSENTELELSDCLM